MKISPHLYCLFLGLPILCEAQNFQSASDCESRYEAVRSQAKAADTAYADCAAGVRNGQVQDCSQMTSQQRISTVRTWAAKRDALLTEAENINLVCRKMLSIEREKERQGLISRAAEKERLELDEKIRRNQTAAAREADQRRQQEMQQEKQRRDDALATQYRSNQRLDAVGKLLELTQKLNRKKDRFETESHSPNKEDSDAGPSSSRSTYEDVEKRASALARPLRRLQAPAVNAIQKDAWKHVNDANIQTLENLEMLEREVREVSSDRHPLTRPYSTSTPNPFGQGMR